MAELLSGSGAFYLFAAGCVGLVALLCMPAYYLGRWRQSKLSLSSKEL